MAARAGSGVVALTLAMQLQFAATGARIRAATSRSEACQYLKCVVHLRLELSVLSFFSGLGAIFSCMIETIFSSAFDKTKKIHICAATGTPTCAATGAPACAATGARITSIYLGLLPSRDRAM